MKLDRITAAALKTGKRQANDVLARRKKAWRSRARALATQPQPPALRKVPARLGVLRMARAMPVARVTRGVLVAEGDSWFDYPLNDVLKILEDDHGYDIESVAHKGDPIEEMAYGRHQLEDLTRRLERVFRHGWTPRAVLLSGGGNDVAGREFGTLLNHARSPISGLNQQMVAGVLDRIYTAYVTILSAVTRLCQSNAGAPLPIVVHGYDYPVPDGRGFLGGWWFLPGPWLEPGFREKGYEQINRRIALTRELIDRFNIRLKQVVALQQFSHVRYIDLRGTLSTGADYRKWWANELHPTGPGFERVTQRFVQVLNTLP